MKHLTAEVLPEVFFYPESEDQLHAQMIRCAITGGLVTKIAYVDNGQHFEEHPAWDLIKNDQFKTAKEACTTVAVIDDHLDTLTKFRAITDNGGLIRRFHVVRDDGSLEREAGRPPHVSGPYYQYLALHFAQLLGPFGGEQSYAIPEEVAEAAGLHKMKHEMQAFEAGCRIVGGAAVHYAANASVLARAIFPASSQQALQASEVANGIVDILGERLEDYRLPYILPSWDVLDYIGQRMTDGIVDGPYQAVDSFRDLAPPAYRYTG